MAFVVAWLFAGSARKHYDYTPRIAAAFLDGHVGLSAQPPSWLNEMVPHEGRYYSVFPLGSVLCVLPLVVLQKLSWLDEFPLRALIAGLAALATLFAYGLTERYNLPPWRRMLFAFLPVFGTCLWPNLNFGGAWQVAIGFAVVGELGALFFVLGSFRPLLAGAFFAMAFGNRTEILLGAPVFYFLIAQRPEPQKWPWRHFVAFSIFPLLLGIATLAYNAARFGSPGDFGYARIPGVLEEPWYGHGLFSAHYLWPNAQQMLLQPWKTISAFPWLVPTGWGGSILISSPFLLLVMRRRPGNGDIYFSSWVAILWIGAVLWLHGNVGGWQVSYRYASELFPWAFLLLLETELRDRIGWIPALGLLAIFINAWSTWIFCGTNYMTP